MGQTFTKKKALFVPILYYIRIEVSDEFLCTNTYKFLLNLYFVITNADVITLQRPTEYLSNPVIYFDK